MRPLQQKTLDILKAQKFMTHEDWLNQIYAGKPEPTLGTLKVTISGIRKAGYQVNSVWGRGYELV